MEEEYTIIEEPRKRPEYDPTGYKYVFERNVDEEKGQYDLGVFDRRVINDLIRFVRDGYEPYYSAETMDKILRRGIANNKDKILSGTDILRFLENDKAAGVLLMCRQLNMSICGLYQCAPDDPADSSSAFVMAFDDGIIRKKEKKKLADMMEFRRECSFMLNVELPSDRTVYDWYELTMRIMSRCYGIKINDKPR